MGGIDAALAKGTIDDADGDSDEDRGPRALALFEPCDSGRAAMREAAELANAGIRLTVVTLAPQARPMPWGRGGGEGPYNIAVREEAERELAQARELLGSVAPKATFTVLVGCPEPPLVTWAAERGFNVVLLPYHRMTLGGNRFARRLRRSSTADVRLVS